MDHTCTPPNGALAPTPVSLPPAGVAKPTAYPSLGAHGPFPPAAATAIANALAGWMANAAASSSVQAAVVTASSLPLSTKSRWQHRRCSLDCMTFHPLHLIVAVNFCLCISQ